MPPETILVMGPFPAPVHGFSMATSELARAINARGPVRRYDLASKAGNRVIAKLGNAAKALGGVGALIGFRLSGGRQVSLGCNGGSGLVFTYLLLRVGTALGLRCALHHHSYAYINDHVDLMARIVDLSTATPGVVHVFLAKQMQVDFTVRYGVVDGAVLPNAYMVPTAPPRGVHNAPIAIGLLSNLSRAKGLDRFIDLVRRLHAEAVPFRARLAGPVAPEDAALLQEALVTLPELQYAGPLYGTAKDAWLADLDLFVFPTNYRNEAQPIVIYEAMAQGVPTLTVDRGCIAEQVGDSLTAMSDLSAFDAQAAALVTALAGPKRTQLHAAQVRAQVRLAKDKAKARATLDRLFGPEAGRSSR
jgi:glycosyltransferase involved in cell wall biosynthesis